MEPSLLTLIIVGVCGLLHSYVVLWGKVWETHANFKKFFEDYYSAEDTTDAID